MSIIRVENNNVLQTRCDVLVLKYAQGFFGADLAVANALGLSDSKEAMLSPGEYLRIRTEGKLPCKSVVFVGVPSLWYFSYTEIREF